MNGGKLDYSSNKGKGIVFNTHSFTEAEVRQMCIELEAEFGLVCWLKLNKGSLGPERGSVPAGTKENLL
jgi:hypothetical protein